MEAPRLSILIINPNTSTNMTSGLGPAIESLHFHGSNVHLSYFTCPPPGIASINSPDDAFKSAEYCLPHLIPLIPQHDAFLVACYSHHPLVSQLRAECSNGAETGDGARPRKNVTGIFEASVAASLSLVSPYPGAAPSGFGIVSTGKVWEEALATAVREYLAGDSTRFLGCETTGLNASELHDLPAEIVRVKMMEATKRLVDRGRERGVRLRAVCLGCAGMVGLEEAVRAALVEGLGVVEGTQAHIVDGVKAGVGMLVMLARCGF